MAIPRLYNQTEAMKLLHIGRRKLLELASAGVLPAYCIHGRFRFLPADIEVFQQKVQTPVQEDNRTNETEALPQG